MDSVSFKSARHNLRIKQRDHDCSFQITDILTYRVCVFTICLRFKRCMPRFNC